MMASLTCFQDIDLFNVIVNGVDTRLGMTHQHHFEVDRADGTVLRTFHWRVAAEAADEDGANCVRVVTFPQGVPTPVEIFKDD